MILQIPISLEAKIRLSNTWGPEVILQCQCGQIPSHTMWGQYPPARCPVCKQKCETIFQDWGIITDGP